MYVSGSGENPTQRREERKEKPGELNDGTLRLAIPSGKPVKSAAFAHHV
jgi:hypothetical protein